METPRHYFQLHLLLETLGRHWADRRDVFLGGNMFLYFSTEQLRGRDLRGPDFFRVLDVPRRERKCWVVWQEGRGPDLVIELLSESTAHVDKGEKKRVYQDVLQVQEYYWYDPLTAELAGFTLEEGVYQPLPLDGAGAFHSDVAGLRLVRWNGIYSEIESTWLRWATTDGALLPTNAEVAAVMARERDEARRRIAELEAQLARMRQQDERSIE